MVISLLIFDKYPYLLEKLHLLFDYKSILLCIMIMILNVIINTILHIRNVGNYYD